MNRKELRQIDLHFVDKGYTEFDDIYYADDLYNATREEKEECMEYINEIIDEGRNNFNIDD